MDSIGRHRQALIAVWLVLILSTMPRVGMALEPAEILLVANGKSSEGVELARYYALKRNIPDNNLIVLNLPVEEVCTRDQYERQIAIPVRAFLKGIKPSWRIRCIVLMYGMPLKVAPSDPVDVETTTALKTRETELKRLSRDREEAGEPESPSAFADELNDVRNRLNQQKISSDQWASVDSELSIVRISDAPVGGWIENPFYIGFRKRPAAIPRDKVLMVSLPFLSWKMVLIGDPLYRPF